MRFHESIINYTITYWYSRKTHLFQQTKIKCCKYAELTVSTFPPHLLQVSWFELEEDLQSDQSEDPGSQSDHRDHDHHLPAPTIKIKCCLHHT